MANTRPTSLRSAERQRRRWHHRLLAGSAVAALALGGSIVAATASTSHATPQLQVISASPYTGVLGNANSFSLYVLSIESTGKLHCTGACLKTWPPDLVKSSTKSVSVGKGVKGKVGFVKRSSTTKQVTFNGFPVYRFSGDKKAKQANGEGIVADGGTWTLVSAAATKASTTPVKEKAFLTSVNSSPYTNVLATTKGNSLYVLSAESGGTLHCTGSCLSFWPPLLVGSTVKSITLASGITGTIGFVSRSSTTKQVTFNGFPVYTYSGDSGPAQNNGEGIAADGGTWGLASSKATTSGTTEIPPAVSTPTTTYHY